MPEIDFAGAIESNWIKLGTLEMEAVGDRMIVVQDDFRFGTECTVCGARDIRMISQTEQRSVVACEDCGGRGNIVRDNATGVRVSNPSAEQLSSVHSGLVSKKCSTCDGNGWHVCEACNGTGTEAGLIAHPKDREQRPTTGTIVSVGDRVTKFKRGDSIIYPSFVGHFWQLNAVDIEGNDVQVEVGVMREEEAIARVKGHLELRRVKSSKALGTAA